MAARFIDKAEDAKEVAKLIEEFQEAISRYQVSGYIRVWGRALLTWEGRSLNNKRSTTKSRISR